MSNRRHDTSWIAKHTRTGTGYITHRTQSFHTALTVRHSRTSDLRIGDPTNKCHVSVSSRVSCAFPRGCALPANFGAPPRGHDGIRTNARCPGLPARRELGE
eukprot:1849372-Prymnesium_polylepis.1